MTRPTSDPTSEPVAPQTAPGSDVASPSEYVASLLDAEAEAFGAFIRGDEAYWNAPPVARCTHPESRTSVDEAGPVCSCGARYAFGVWARDLPPPLPNPSTPVPGPRPVANGTRCPACRDGVIDDPSTEWMCRACQLSTPPHGEASLGGRVAELERLAANFDKVVDGVIEREMGLVDRLAALEAIHVGMGPTLDPVGPTAPLIGDHVEALKERRAVIEWLRSREAHGLADSMSAAFTG